MYQDKVENQSLYGVIVEKDGAACIEVNHRDGSIEHIPIKNPDGRSIVRNFSDQFENTETIPSPWVSVDTEVLTPNNSNHAVLKLPASEHIRRSCELEALMYKYFCDPKSETTSILDCRGNELAKSIIRDLQNIVGGEWLEKVLK